jgi:hypothetical protein
MSIITLTTAQHAILAHAIHHTEGRIDWFPENIKGGARQKVLQGLFNRALVTPNGENWLIAAEGYDALGCARPTVGMLVPDPGLDAAVAQSEASLAQDLTNAPAPAEQPVAKAIRTREHSKQATILGMLQRTEGATIAQICEATGWQAHTVRGTFAGALKKKLGLTITSDKQQGGERIYRATV